VTLRPNGEVHYTSDGPIHRFRALLPQRSGPPGQPATSLYVSFNGLSLYWPLQEPLFRLILDNLRPY
jgi:hypothetical protein